MNIVVYGYVGIALAGCVALGLAGLRLGILVVGINRMKEMLRRSKEAKLVQARKMSLPGEVDSAHADLLQRGFTLSAFLVVPSAEARVHFSMVYVSPDEMTAATFLYGANDLAPTLVWFESIFHDDFMLVTGWPWGMDATTSAYKSRYVTTSLDEALVLHEDTLINERQTRGAPVQFSDLQALERLDIDNGLDEQLVAYVRAVLLDLVPGYVVWMLVALGVIALAIAQDPDLLGLMIGVEVLVGVYIWRREVTSHQRLVTPAPIR